MKNVSKGEETIRYLDAFGVMRLFKLGESEFERRYSRTLNGGILASNLVKTKFSGDWWIFVRKDVQIFDEIGMLRISVKKAKQEKK